MSDEDIRFLRNIILMVVGSILIFGWDETKDFFILVTTLGGIGMGFVILLAITAMTAVAFLAIGFGELEAFVKKLGGGEE